MTRVLTSWNLNQRLSIGVLFSPPRPQNGQVKTCDANHNMNVSPQWASGRWKAPINIMKPNAFISTTSAGIRSSFNNRCWHSILYVRALIKFIGVRPHTKVGISIFIAAERTSKNWIVLLCSAGCMQSGREILHQAPLLKLYSLSRSSI